MSGAMVALDHTAVRANMKTLGIKKGHRRDIMMDIVLMEREAIRIFVDRASRNDAGS